ncbi:prepilin peptidase [Stenotrophomonas sp. PS02297]|uniref:prepilin peptidase n=1 Tax=Stenotrophomonas sp. PS02297 TaxID=2991423 RepID=UPI00249B0AAA|nr:prepilin peptidase [Stenotrophomonas sp. PS02297]
MPPLSASIAVILGLQVIYTDLYARRAPNRGLLAAAMAGILTMLVLPSASTGLADAMAGLLLGLVLLLPFHLIGWMGAGDVKLFSVLGLLLGGSALLPLWIIASLLAGVHATAWIAAKNRVFPDFIANYPPAIRAYRFVNESELSRKMKASRKGRRGIPYAAYLGVATLLVVFTGISHG